MSNFGIANTYLFAFIEFENIEDHSPKDVIFLPDDSLTLKGKKEVSFKKTQDITIIVYANFD